MFLMFYVSLSIHYPVRRGTVEPLTSPRGNYPLLPAPSKRSLGVFLFACVAANISSSKSYDAETHSGKNDDAYSLSGPCPAFET